MNRFTAKSNYRRGSQYDRSNPRILILGESWWGTEEGLADVIPKWCNFKYTDRTFTRIFNTISEVHSDKASTEQRAMVWAKYAFYNFVPGTLGKDRSIRPTKKHYESAIEPFNRLLNELKPHIVWILGIGQSEYSLPILAKRPKIEFSISKHPAAVGVSNKELQTVWRALLKKANTKT